MLNGMGEQDTREIWAPSTKISAESEIHHLAMTDDGSLNSSHDDMSYQLDTTADGNKEGDALANEEGSSTDNTIPTLDAITKVTDMFSTVDSLCLLHSRAQSRPAHSHTHTHTP